jgi:outer membrane lipoprotein-sorting protein
MVPDNSRGALAAVTLGSLVVLSGVGIGGVVAVQHPSDDVPSTQLTHAPSDDPDETNDSSTPTGDEVVERFEERIESLESVVMAYETNTTINGNTTMTSERRMWVDYENDRVRTEWETDRTHVITVRNESGMVSYDVENNQLNRFNVSADMTHVTPVDTLVTETEIAYEGRDRIDGEEAYRLTVTPTNASALGSVNVTVWLDTDTYFPTVMTSEIADDEHDFERTTHFRSVSLNASIPDDRFTIDVPDNATEPEQSFPDVTEYDSLSSLREDTNRSVPSPEIPDAYSFEEGYVVADDDSHSITLHYTTDDDESLTVVKHPPMEYNFSESDRYETIDVGNHTGYYTEYEYDGNTTSVVVVPCGDTTYRVSGDRSKDETVGVADSLTCE